MSHRPWRLVLCSTLCAAGWAAAALAQPVGAEFRVNTYTTLNQRTDPFGAHLVAADAAGNFVVVWHGEGTGDDAGMASVSNARAVAAGMTFRPIDATAKDTLAWFKTLPPERQAKLKAGIAPEREEKVLQALRAPERAAG